MTLTRPLVVLDLETTGTWIDKDRIIEIAMIKVNPDLPAGRQAGPPEIFNSKVNPAMPIPAVVTELTGISDADVKDAPAFALIAGKVVAFLADADLGGFNVERFDLPLLSRELATAGFQWDFSGRTIYDAQKIYHVHERRDLFAAFTFYCKKELNNAHCALADTQASLDILAEQVKRYGAGREDIEALKGFDYKASSEFFDTDRKFRWWNGELYMTFGKYARKEPVNVVAKKDPAYLQWILEKDFSDEVKVMIQNALNGRYPKPPGPH